MTAAKTGIGTTADTGPEWSGFHDVRAHSRSSVARCACSACWLPRSGKKRRQPRHRHVPQGMAHLGREDRVSIQEQVPRCDGERERLAQLLADPARGWRVAAAGRDCPAPTPVESARGSETPEGELWKEKYSLEDAGSPLQWQAMIGAAVAFQAWATDSRFTVRRMGFWRGTGQCT
jgi:hypothetical protein